MGKKEHPLSPHLQSVFIKPGADTGKSKTEGGVDLRTILHGAVNLFMK